jgi:hypothetical protein
LVKVGSDNEQGKSMKNHNIPILVAAAMIFCLGPLACSDGSKKGDGGLPDGGDTDDDAGNDGGDECVETADGTFPGQAVEIAWDADDADKTILDYGWNPINGAEGTYLLEEEPLWEAVRFDLTAPATVYGARVKWGNLTGGGIRPVTLGAYEDFGSNGFDFYQWESMWDGDRCLSPDDQGEWVDYVFETPIEVEIPGLFYISQYWETEEDPRIMFGPNSSECTTWDDCHSAINMPLADANSYYNGLTLQFPYDFAVRLMVEWHDDIPAADKWFQPGGLSVSSRVAWGDYDNDGDDDLMTNGPTLYENDGSGGFTDVTSAAGIDAVAGSCGGGVWGDYDNDGWLDFMCLGNGKSAWDPLLHNNQNSTFTDVTAASGISDFQDALDCDTGIDPEYSPTEGVAWVDMDNDGLLDIYQAQYECGAIYQNYIDRIWHNEGGGVFTEWNTGHGFTSARQAGRGVSPLDYDMDGDMDIFVSNYRLDPNFMYDNNGTGVFTDVSMATGLIGEYINLYYGHTIGAAWLDAENDGDWDILLSNLAHPRFYDFSDKSQMMINNGSEVFTDTTPTAGIFYRETHSNPTVADFNNDGYTDLFFTCVYEGRFSEMYLNNGDGTFTQVNYESGAIAYNGWGSAASDYDNDGDVDLVAYDLFRNDTAADGNNWIQVRALGGMSSSGLVNAAGIGSIVKVTVGGETMMQHTSGGSGCGVQDSAFLVFGLGSATSASEIEVLYPGGAVVTETGTINAGQRIWIQADGTVTYGWAHP